MLRQINTELIQATVVPQVHSDPKVMLRFFRQAIGDLYLSYEEWLDLVDLCMTVHERGIRINGGPPSHS